MRPFIYTFLVLSLLGCGNARVAEVEKAPVTTPKLERFPAESLQTSTNVIFLWKRGVTPQQVSEMSVLGDRFGQLKARLDAIVALRGPVPPELPQQMKATRDRMLTLCDRFTAPKTVDLKLQGPAPTVALEGWTSPITAVTYTEEGGIVTFSSREPSGDEWKFRLARNRYELNEKGFISFYGEITVKTTDGQTRYGVAKLFGKKAR